MPDFNASPSHLLHRARQRADELLTRHLSISGLTPRQFAVMCAVQKEPGLSQVDITNRTGTDRSTIAELIVRLEKDGLVQRSRSKRDARAHVVDLGPKGEERIQLALPALHAADSELLTAIPADARDEFVFALQQIAQAQR